MIALIESKAFIEAVTWEKWKGDKQLDCCQDHATDLKEVALVFTEVFHFDLPGSVFLGQLIVKQRSTISAKAPCFKCFVHLHNLYIAKDYGTVVVSQHGRMWLIVRWRIKSLIISCILCHIKSKILHMATRMGWP